MKMTNETQTQKLLEILVVDDRQENLDLARKIGTEFSNTYDTTYCGFDDAIRRLGTDEYDAVITDLFEGEYVPKGLLVVERCLDRNIPVGILTDGERHCGALAGIRYGVGETKVDCSLVRGDEEAAKRAFEEYKKLHFIAGREGFEEKLYESVRMYGGDPIMRTLIGGNGWDKRDPETWEILFGELIPRWMRGEKVFNLCRIYKR